MAFEDKPQESQFIPAGLAQRAFGMRQNLLNTESVQRIPIVFTVSEYFLYSKDFAVFLVSLETLSDVYKGFCRF